MCSYLEHLRDSLPGSEAVGLMVAWGEFWDAQRWEATVFWKLGVLGTQIVIQAKVQILCHNYICFLDQSKCFKILMKIASNNRNVRKGEKLLRWKPRRLRSNSKWWGKSWWMSQIRDKKLRALNLMKAKGKYDVHP